ncbi:MAG: hypothetical protein ABIR56_00270 [Polaromonas sp.]
MPSTTALPPQQDLARRSVQAIWQPCTQMKRALAPLQRDARLEHFRQIRMIWAFDVREPLAGFRFAERFHLAGRTRELLIRPIGRTVYLMPPSVLAGQFMATLDDVLKQPDLPHADQPSDAATA